jgi:DNA-binding NtrC family response regulator
MTRPRVLVVEDKESVLRAIAAILEPGYDVAVASTGDAAMSLIRAQDVDVVLTDIRMAGATGFEVLRGVRNRSPRTAVVMMTAYANVPDAVAAIKLGAFDYVAKPLDADEISLVVARAVESLREAPACGEPVTESPSPAAGPTSLDVSLGFHRAVEEARDRASREYLVRLMRLFHGNVTHAATRAAMTRESLHRVLRKYGVSTEPHREHAADERTAADPCGHERGTAA